MTTIVAIDIGGTHARFALAQIEGQRVTALGEAFTVRTANHDGLLSAWAAFETQSGPLPRAAAIGVAAPMGGELIRFVNSSWTVRPGELKGQLGIDHLSLLNDFGAMAHAADALGEGAFESVFGPDVPLPAQGSISVIGPGTGLGVAVLHRVGGHSIILETEGAHIHFAPLCAEEQAVSDAITARHGRTSVERIVSGPGLGEIVRASAPHDMRSDAALWTAALDSTDDSAVAALNLFMGAYGSAVGDLSLAHGGHAVVLTGGLTNRMTQHLKSSKFHNRFCDKGRYRDRMVAIPIKLITHPQPGLFGAAAAFAKEHMF